MISIKSVLNGYVLETEALENPLANTQVFEYSDLKEFDELEAAQRMLYEVILNLGLYGSKHDAKRLRVVIEENDETLSID